MAVIDVVWRVERLERVKFVSFVGESPETLFDVVARFFEAVTLPLDIGDSVFFGVLKAPLVLSSFIELVVPLPFCDDDGNDLVDVLLVCAAAIGDVVRTPAVTVDAPETMSVIDSSVELVTMLGTMLVFNVFNNETVKVLYGDANGVITAVADDAAATSVVLLSVLATSVVFEDPVTVSI